jgi:hypothetical protein
VTKVLLEVSNLFSYADVARQLGIKRPYIYYLIKKHNLTPFVISSTNYLLREQVDVLRKELENNGRTMPKGYSQPLPRYQEK